VSNAGIEPDVDNDKMTSRCGVKCDIGCYMLLCSLLAVMISVSRFLQNGSYWSLQGLMATAEN